MRRSPVLLAAALLLPLAACAGAPAATNAGGGGDVDTTSSSAGSVGASSSSGGTSSSGGQASSNTQASSAAPVAAKLSTLVDVRDVAVFQAVKTPIMTSGVAIPTTTSPILPNRDSAFRIYVSPHGAGSSAPVTATLVLLHGTQESRFQASMPVTRASDDAIPSSVFTLPVPAAAMLEGSRWRVELTAQDGVEAVANQAHAARYPTLGDTAALPLAQDPGRIHLVLVPVQWERDGSHRLPDTSPAQVATIQALMAALYPTTQVDVSVHAPFPWNHALTLTGNVSFGSLNDDLTNLRNTDGAGPDAYYYALVNAADTFDDYCGNSCVTGQSYVVDDPADADLRVGGGVGFSGVDSAWTLAHEVGHMHGRSHAPCDVGSADQDYPYDGAQVGVWGWDVRTGSFVDPSQTTDFMGYCDPTWISDYTWNALAERVKAVNALGVGALRQRQDHWSIHVEDGQASLGRVVRLASQSLGPRVEVRLEGPHGAVLGHVMARVVQTGDGGAAVMVPFQNGVERISFQLDGLPHAVPTR